MYMRKCECSSSSRLPERHQLYTTFRDDMRSPQGHNILMTRVWHDLMAYCTKARHTQSTNHEHRRPADHACRTEKFQRLYQVTLKNVLYIFLTLWYVNQIIHYMCNIRWSSCTRIVQSLLQTNYIPHCYQRIRLQLCSYDFPEQISKSLHFGSYLCEYYFRLTLCLLNIHSKCSLVQVFSCMM